MSEGVTNGEAPIAGQDDEISLLDLAIVLAKRKVLIAKLALAVPAVALLISFAIPDRYSGTATLMPPQEDQSTAMAILGQLGGIGGIAGPTLGLKTPNELYIGMLKSRTVTDSIIARFKLQELYDKDNLVDTRKKLEHWTTISNGKDGLIRIEFRDKDPQRAADVANAYIEELERLTREIAVTEASKRRLFYERQLGETRKLLAEAELALVKVQEGTGLIKLDDQARAIFESVAALRGQIAAKEVQLASMRSFATDRNPDYIRAREELAGMEQQLKRLERDTKLGGGNILLPTGKVPEAGLEYLRGLRDVKYQEAVFESLAKQLELARVDEGRNATLIQVVDRAMVMDKKVEPDHLLYGLLGAAVGFLLALLSAFALEAWERTRAAPDEAARLQQLRGYLRFR